MLPRIVETKHNLDGSTERFDCHLLHRDADYLVLCYVSERTYHVAGIELPEGSLTIGHYWLGKECIVWEMYGPAGELVAHYMHLCKNLKFGENSVEWHDMALDIWVSPNGKSRMLDEDEFERYARSGQVGIEETHRIKTVAEHLRANVSSTVRELKQFDRHKVFAMLKQNE